MDAVDTLDLIGLEPDLDGRLVHRAVIPERPARFAEPATPFGDETTKRLATRGIEQLYTHQAAAIDLIRSGQHVALATGTASGKSLCYQLPILERVVDGEPTTALLVFPTKALAQDQLRSLRSWLVPGLKAVTYDGDSSPDDRAWARKNANVVLTNPEMLHQGLLPYHERWATFLMRLDLVVVDELHTLRGVFGSHVAMVLRRLRRVCQKYGARPTFCFASATIGNPGELASELAGVPVTTVDDDGSPSAQRVLACWQRPLIEGIDGVRTSANAETGELLARFVRAGHQTLAFTRSRRGTELVARHARATLDDDSLSAQIASYRGGYLPAERRELERSLTSGELRGVAATNALELGIDIGGLDAVVLNGFPGTLASMRQQVGRAGRAERRAAAVLIAGDDQLDQWFVRNPDQLISRPAERGVIKADNPFVLVDHVGCAAHELPLTHDDEVFFGEGLHDAVRELVLADKLKPRGDRMYWSGDRHPAPVVGLRGSGSTTVDLVHSETGELIGTVDAARVPTAAHEGAIYLHRGRQYRVTSLALNDAVALLEPADDLDEYTQARTDTDIEITYESESIALGPAAVHVGTVDVSRRVTGYQRRRASTRAVIETVPLDFPDQTLSTRACWYTIPIPALLNAGLEPRQILGTVHAAEHALIGMLPRFAICDRWDVGGVSMAEHPQTSEPSVFIYDGYPGGVGIADLAYQSAARHVAATAALVQNCGCDDGCPSCVQSPKCGNWNEYLDKDGAVTWLRTVAAGPEA